MSNTTKLIAAALLATAPSILTAQDVAGAYLAARQAGISSDYTEGARYFAQAVTNDPTNIAVLENALITMIAKNDEAQIERIVGLVDQAEGDSRIAELAKYALAMRDGAFDLIPAPPAEISDLDQMFDGLLYAWAQIGAGDVTEADRAFAIVAENEDFAGFAHYQNALARAAVGDFEQAQAILSGEAHGPLVLSTGGIEAQAQVLVQLDRVEDAKDLLRQTLDAGRSPELAALLDRIEKDEPVTYDFVTTPQEGAAEVYFSLASVLLGRAEPPSILLYVRLANLLRPDHAQARIVSAEMLGDLEQHDLATKAFAAVPTEDPSHVLAELGRANALFNDGREDAAAEVLEALAKDNPDDALVRSSLAEILSRLERNDEAIAAYTRAIELSPEGQTSDWAIYYRRGILHEQRGDFEQMEADFRKALELEPDQPEVLNYLGYSLVEQRQKLDEALGMIEAAVEKRPESGYITDSLGWVFYRLDRFEEAVAPMERAVELEPVDPIINDHLGDVYWKVGRKREAEFQWKRALSFDPEEKDAERIKRKLDFGLDAVLSEEEQTQVPAVAND